MNLKATKTARAQAPAEVVFGKVRDFAMRTPGTEGVELKAPSYGIWHYNEGRNAVEIRLDPQGDATDITLTHHLPKMGAKGIWAGGILSPIITPLLYLGLKRAAGSLVKELKTQAESESVSQRRKLQEAGLTKGGPS